MLRIESLLSARSFMAPQHLAGRLYFISNLSGKLSLYAMDSREGGSMPEPLLPPDIALQNPHHMNGYSFHLFPKLGKILIMLDHDGDEVYQPVVIPLSGGYPEPAFGHHFDNYRVHCLHGDPDRNIIYLNAESRSEPILGAWQANLETGELLKLGQSKWGAFVAGHNDDHTQAIISDGYTVGDVVLYHWKNGGDMQLLYGTPLEARAEGQQVPLSSFGPCFFTAGDRGLLLTTSLFNDTYGLGYIDLSDPKEVKPVKIAGLRHDGVGELTNLRRLSENRYAIDYNIDGCSWLYSGAFDEAKLKMKLDSVVCGEGQIADGVLEHAEYDKASETFAVSYSTATSPTQLYTVTGKRRKTVPHIVPHTCERVLGIPDDWLSSGEDARSLRTMACELRRGSTCPPPPSSSRGRDPWCITCTAARKARSGRTFRGSPCRLFNS